MERHTLQPMIHHETIATNSSRSGALTHNGLAPVTLRHDTTAFALFSEQIMNHDDRAPYTTDGTKRPLNTVHPHYREQQRNEATRLAPRLREHPPTRPHRNSSTLVA